MIKYDFYHFGSDTACGDTIAKLPILDWDGYYNPKYFEFKRPKEGRANFTGKFNSVLHATITIARRKFCLSIYFAFGQTTPEKAYREYHDRIKARRSN